MGNKLLFMSWNFVVLKCGYDHYNEQGKKYNPLMEIKEGTVGAYYDCPDEYCPNRIPMLAYEKIMEETRKIIDTDNVQIGYSWKMKCARQNYELTVLNYKEGEKIVIGIKNLTLRKK